MARKRSNQELWDLARYANRRIIDGRGGALSSAVSEKALKAASNIERTKSYQKLANKASFAKSEVERYNYMNKAVNRKYSQRTYMGNAIG